MGFNLIGVGLVFLANPNFNIIDFLPDFIGLVLVYFGLVKLSHINEDLNAAKNMFLTLAAIGTMKFLSIGMIASTDTTWYLLLSFTFGVIECILFLYTANSLFSGIEWLGVKYNSEYVLSTYDSLKIADHERRLPAVKKVKKDVITRVKNTTVAFYFVRTICATLPEFTQIMKEDLYIDYYKLYRSALYIIGAVITIVFAIIYLIRLFSFISGIYKDKQFIESLKAAHHDFEVNNANYRISRCMRIALVMFSLAILATVRIGEDGLSLIPTAIPSACLILSALIMCRADKRSLITLIPALPLSVLSFKNYSAKLEFYTGTTKFEDIFHFEKYMDKFSPISNLNMLEYVLLTASFGILATVMFGSMRRHLKWDREYKGMSENRINTVKTENKSRLEKLIKLQYAFLAIVMVMNTVGIRLAIAIGFIGSDFAVVAYQIFIILAIVLTFVSFAVSRRLSEFANEEIYNVEYSWSVYEAAEN